MVVSTAYMHIYKYIDTYIWLSKIGIVKEVRKDFVILSKIHYKTSLSDEAIGIFPD